MTLSLGLHTISDISSIAISLQKPGEAAVKWILYCPSDDRCKSAHTGLKSRKEFCLTRGYKTILIFTLFLRFFWTRYPFVYLSPFCVLLIHLCEPIMQCGRERSAINELTCVILLNLFSSYFFWELWIRGMQFFS